MAPLSATQVPLGRFSEAVWWALASQGETKHGSQYDKQQVGVTESGSILTLICTRHLAFLRSYDTPRYRDLFSPPLHRMQQQQQQY